MPTTGHDRRAVLIGILCAWGASSVFIGLGVLLTARAGVFNGWTALDAAGFAILLAGVPLVIGIGWTAKTRHFATNIDGSTPETGSKLDILKRNVTNTTEQALLFSIAVAGFAVAAPDRAAQILPVMGCWFVLARLAFLVGYLYSPLTRAFGFAATFHPTIALLVCALWAFVLQGGTG